jgi:cation diffusion facilitator family transporter
MVGAVANLALVACKAGAGALSNSSALMADAAHSLGDLLSDAITLAALGVASQPADEDHPYGHGKFESLAALVVSAMLCGTGVGVGVHSIDLLSVLFNSSAMAAAAAAGDATATTTPDAAAAAASGGEHLGVAAAVAAGSIAVKEALYRATKQVGVDTGSPVLIANAHHHRSDALSSVVALGGVRAHVCVCACVRACACTQLQTVCGWMRTPQETCVLCFVLLLLAFFHRLLQAAHATFIFVTNYDVEMDVASPMLQPEVCASNART